MEKGRVHVPWRIQLIKKSPSQGRVRAYTGRSTRAFHAVVPNQGGAGITAARGTGMESLIIRRQVGFGKQPGHVVVLSGHVRRGTAIQNVLSQCRGSPARRSLKRLGPNGSSGTRSSGPSSSSPSPAPAIGTGSSSAMEPTSTETPRHPPPCPLRTGNPARAGPAKHGFGPGGWARAAGIRAEIQTSYPLVSTEPCCGLAPMGTRA